LTGTADILSLPRKPNISVIVPYHNEGKAVLRTLNRLVAQTLPPAEILMIDSSSTDDGPDLLERWLQSRKISRPRIRSVRLGSTTPSSSKNLGILLARCPWVGFMDCGHLFFPQWLEDQWRLIASTHRPVYGKCRFTGHGPFDSCAVAQTYGLGNEVETIPGSLMKKSLFQKVGFFAENRRAGYDVAWRKRASDCKVSFLVSPLPNIRYESTEVADHSLYLFFKSVSYARATLGLGSANFVQKYFLLSLVVSLALWARPAWWPGFLLLYLVGRGFIWPAWRSAKIAPLFQRYPQALVLLPWTGFLCDFGRILGIFTGLFAGTNREHDFRFEPISTGKRSEKKSH